MTTSKPDRAHKNNFSLVHWFWIDLNEVFFLRAEDLTRMVEMCATQECMEPVNGLMG